MGNFNHPSYDMYFDITTPENQLRAKKAHQKHLCDVLTAAISIYNRLDENDMSFALKAVTKINRIRYQVYEKAMELGYVKKCITSISVCKGECCKWHFPKKLRFPDFFITVCGSSSKELTALKDQILFDNGKYQCPVLRENGCLLSFDSRPLACSNAYPCFSGELYHNFLERKRKEVDAQYLLLNEIYQKWTNHRNYDTSMK
jgi:hypothetical protein